MRPRIGRKFYREEKQHLSFFCDVYGGEKSACSSLHEKLKEQMHVVACCF